MNFAAISIDMLTKLLGKIVDAFKGFASISVGGIAKSLISIGVSMGILLGVTKKIQTKDIGALMASAIAINILARSIAILGNLGLIGVAAGLVGLAGTFTILSVSMKVLIPMVSGMFKVAGGIATLSGSLVLLGLAIGTIGLGFGIFTTSLITAFLGFKLIGWDTIAKGLIGIASAFVIIGVAAHVLKPMIGSIFALAGAIAVFSLSVAAMGVGISLIVQALSIMAAVGKEGAESAGAALKALVSNILELIPIAIKQLGLSLKELLIIIKDMIPLLGEILIDTVHTLVQVLITCAPDIVDGFFELIVQALTMLNKYVPTIANLLFDFVISVLNTLSIRTPEMVTAVINFLAKLFDSVVQVFSEFGAGELLKAVVALGVLTIVMKLMAGLVHIVPQAMLGILAFGLLITELAAVISAVGALSRIPGFKELVTDGGNFLQIIGTAIGQFVGGLVGGIAKGVTSSLPDIASNLSNFMTNLQPFIEGIKNVSLDIVGKTVLLGAALAIFTAAGFIASIMSFLSGGGLGIPLLGIQLSAFMIGAQAFLKGMANIDPNTLESVSALAKAILVLTAANLLNSISNFMGIFGSGGLSGFGIQIALLGLGMRGFVDNLGTFTDDQVKSVKYACDALTALAKASNEIPNSGGLVSLFTGDNDISEFGSKLPLLGLCLNGFVKTLGTFSDDEIKSVTCAANAIKILSSAGNEIPNSGGLGSLFSGDNDFGSFGLKLPLLGLGLSLFVKSLGGGFSDDEVSTIGYASEAIKTLANAANEIPNSGGIKSLVEGDNDIAKFGLKLPMVGKYLSKFVSNLGEFNEDKIKIAKCAADCIVSISSAASNIPNSGGLKSLIEGDNDISEFGSKLPIIGKYLSKFIKNLDEFNDDKIKTARCAADCIATMASVQVSTTGGLKSLFTGNNDISEFGSNLPTVAKYLSKFISNLGEFNEGKVSAAKFAADCIATMASVQVPTTGGLKSLFTGNNDISEFGLKLPFVGLCLKKFIETLEGIGEDQVKTANYAGQVISTLANSTANIPTTGGLKSLFDGDNDISKFSGKLPNVGKHISDFISNVGEFKEGQVETAKFAAEALASIAGVEVPKTNTGLKALFDGDNDISKFSSKLPNLANNLKQFISNLGEFKSDNLETVNAGIEAIKAIGSLSGLNIKDTGANLEEFGARITSFAWKLTEYLSAMSNVNADDLTASINKIKELVEMLGNITTESITNLSNFTDKLGKVGKDGINEFVKAIKDEQPKTDVVNGINDIIQALLNKIEERIGDINKKSKKMADEAINEIKQPRVANEAANAGKFFVQGFANGINNNLYLARDAGSQVGKKALEAAKKAIDSNSPSKETYKLGTFFDQGFVNGIKAFGNNIYKESYSIGDRARIGLSKAIKGVSDLITNGIDDDITIRPILDLSNVESGISSISGMFNNPSLGVSANLNAISSGMRAYRQNGGEDVISAIDRLGKNLGNTSGDTYNINGITYDNGTEIQEAVSTLVRAARIERRT